MLENSRDVTGRYLHDQIHIGMSYEILEPTASRIVRHIEDYLI